MKLILYAFLSITFFSCNPIKSIVGGKTSLDQDFFNERSSTTLKNGLISFWKLDESSSFAPRVDINSLNTLSVLGSIPGIIGKFGNSVDCSSASGSNVLKVSSPLHMDFGTTGDFSLSFWIYANSFVAGKYPFEFSSGYSVSFVGSDEVRFNLDGNFVKVNISTGSWNHIVFVIDRDSGYTSYLNGSFYDLTSYNSTTPSYSNAEVRLCSQVSGSNTFNGNLDSVGIWNRALTEDEINELSSGGALD